VIKAERAKRKAETMQSDITLGRNYPSVGYFNIDSITKTGQTMQYNNYKGQMLLPFHNSLHSMFLAKTFIVGISVFFLVNVVQETGLTKLQQMYKKFLQEASSDNNMESDFDMQTYIKQVI